MITALNNVRQIDAGNVRAAALLTNGTVYNWGANTGGQLGLGHNNYTSSPAQVGAGVLTDIVGLALNTGATIAVHPDGTTHVWGNNSYGELGIPSPSYASTPTPGPAFSAGVQISGQHFQFLSIERTGTIKTWGSQPLGYTPSSPTQFGGSSVPTTPGGVCQGVPNADFPACGPQRAYFQRPGATYVAARHGFTVSPAEIGTYGTTTTIDASQAPYNGAVIFDGIYHLRGNVRFIGGSFTLAPFTRLYVDGASGQAGNFTSYNQTTIEVQNATLTLRATTLQASCPAQWGGIVLNGQASIYTYAQGQRQQNRSVIRDAYRGIDSYTPNLNFPNTNRYYLTYTDFINNGTGLYDYVKGTALTGEGARYCSFRDGEIGINVDPADSSPGNVFGGNYSSALFEFNTFDNLKWGMIGVLGQGRINNNTFTNNYYCALATGSTSGGPLEIRNNTITVPSVWPAAVLATLPSGYPPTSYGIQGERLVSIKTNTIAGANPNPTATNVVQIGLDWPGSCSVSDGNIFRYLDQAINMSTDAYNGSTHSILNNTFADNVTGLSFLPSSTLTGAPVSVTLRCNTFSSTVPGAVGVWVQANAMFPNQLGSASQPNGNNFSGIATANKRFVYDGSTLLTYFRYASPQEGLGGPNGNTIYNMAGNSSTGSGSNPLGTSGLNACGTSSTTPGVYARPTGGGQLGEPMLGPATGDAVLRAAYPNPASEAVGFAYMLPATCQGGRLVLRDLLGRAVATAVLTSLEGEASVPVRHLPAGFYTGMLEADGRVVATQKLSVKH
ncbi:hypothetical protein GCM10023185_10280 [Hymenobacter saemangeumensis]|uniref:T9SS type A sorting domain-containing protein n=2 Tax=Hymenobacter saemangeumensis TaxID=1084522 RepID=A0ABP8I512_9BACT